MTLMVGELAALLSLDNQPFERGLMTSSSGMDRLKGAAVTAAIGIGAALAGGAVYSLSKFSDFQAGMNEVFTLLPGISQSAMDDMSGQVQTFATEFGVLPEKVIPALYQSLSAGVPPGNVFEFLETSQKLAAAGATDLETAVDGLTSTVNAYGQENLSAAEASDIMVTAVRVGKTTVGEMSDALFQVNPIAASLGVNFGDVAAAMSTMTSQGVPTSVAATQLRQLFVELSKEGSNAASTFEELSGRSFTDFIASGGNVQNALEILADEAHNSGGSIADMFGSVEAGQAALSLTGQGSETFFQNLQAMGDAAGATDEAYEQMTEGIRFQLDKLKAYFAVAAVRVGEQVARIAQPLLEFSNKIIRAFSNGGIQGVFDLLERKLGKLSAPMRILAVAGGALSSVLAAGGLVLLVGALGSAIGALISPIAVVAVGIAALAAGLVYAYNNFDGFRAVVDGVVSWLVGTAWPWIQEFAGNIADQWGHLVEWTREHWDQISEAIGHVVGAVEAIVGALVGYVTMIWSAWGDDLINIAGAAWEFIVDLVENAVTVISGIVETVMALINGDWGAAWDGIKQVLGGVWAQMQNMVGFGIQLIRNLITGAVSGLLAFWGAAWDLFKVVLSAAWDAMQQAVSAAISTVLGFLASLPGKILSALASLPGLLVSVGAAMMRGLLSGISSGWGVISAWFASLPSRILGSIGSIGSILVGAGRAVINGLLDGMQDAWGTATSWLSSLNPAAHFNDINVEKGHAAQNLRPMGEAVMAGLQAGMMAGWSINAGWLSSLNPAAHIGGGDVLAGLSSTAAGAAYLDQSTFIIVDSPEEASELVGRRAPNSRAKAEFLQGMR